MIELKKIMFVISAGMLAFEVYDRFKRNKEKHTLAEAEAAIENLERELATVRRNQYESGERRRTFKR